MRRNRVTFEVWHNEGSFFDEPWLHDIETDKDYRYDQVPPRVIRKLAIQMNEEGRIFKAAHVSILCDFILKPLYKQTAKRWKEAAKRRERQKCDSLRRLA